MTADNSFNTLKKKEEMSNLSSVHNVFKLLFKEYNPKFKYSIHSSDVLKEDDTKRSYTVNNWQSFIFTDAIHIMQQYLLPAIVPLESP